MSLLKEYILPRILQWITVIFVGITITFMIPRLSPVNPVEQAIARINSFQAMDPDSAMMMRKSLEELYGVQGTFFEQ